MTIRLVKDEYKLGIGEWKRDVCTPYIITYYDEYHTLDDVDKLIYSLIEMREDMLNILNRA